MNVVFCCVVVDLASGDAVCNNAVCNNAVRGLAVTLPHPTSLRVSGGALVAAGAALAGYVYSIAHHVRYCYCI